MAGGDGKRFKGSTHKLLTQIGKFKTIDYVLNLANKINKHNFCITSSHINNYIKEKYPKAIGILVLPPTLDTLRDRITSRKRDTQEEIEKRLAKAVWEIDQGKKSGFFAHEIINNDIDIAYNAVIKIVNQ